MRILKDTRMRLAFILYIYRQTAAVHSVSGSTSHHHTTPAAPTYLLFR